MIRDEARRAANVTSNLLTFARKHRPVKQLTQMNVIIEEKLYDREFIDKNTIGFDKLVEHVKQYPPEEVEKITWVPADDIKKIARIFAASIQSSENCYPILLLAS